jgi:hypothetical protein
MLTREDDVDAHKLHAKGWTISARRSGRWRAGALDGGSVRAVR